MSAPDCQDFLEFLKPNKIILKEVAALLNLIL